MKKVFGTLALLSLISLNYSAQAQSITYGASATSSDVTGTYAEAHGASAAVSVDVPLKVSMPQKLVLALHDGSTVANHPLFNGQTLPSWDTSNFEINFDGEADPNFPDRTKEKMKIFGLLYTNTENISVLAVLDGNKLVNTEDPTVAVDMQCAYKVSALDGSYVSDLNYLTSAGGLTINSTDLKPSDNVGKLGIECWGKYDSFVGGATRSGDYTGALTITASML